MSIELSPILKKYNDYTLAVMCPGCKQRHLVWIAHPDNPNPHICWDWNKDIIKPTFNPSLKVEYPWWDGEKNIDVVCHSFIRDGLIQFLNDCTHELSGKTVPLATFE